MKGAAAPLCRLLCASVAPALRVPMASRFPSAQALFLGKYILLDSEPFGAGALSSRVFVERRALLLLLELGL